MNKDTVVIHCSAMTKQKYGTAKYINKIHKKRGFREIGYTYFIRTNGLIENGRSENERNAAMPELNMNRRGIHICLHGLNVEDFTPEQFDATANLIKEIMGRHDIKNIICHNLWSKKKKTCPVFNIVDEIFPRLYEARFMR